MSAAHSFPRRRLGWTNEQVSVLGLGCMGMSAFYGAANEDESLKVLNAAIDRGCTFWDTAESYGDNEELLAKVLAKRRNEVFICTKFGVQYNAATNTSESNSTPAMVRSSCEKSLRRLGVSQIDLYYQHRVDPSTPIEQTVGALKELIKEGKLRYYGLSECSAATLRRAHAVHPCAAVEMEYSPWCLDIETTGLLQACRELDIAVVAYSPLGRGFLTGAIRSPDDLAADDWRRVIPRFSKENFPANLKIVDAFQQLAKNKGCTSSQLCLAWLLRQDRLILPIPGTKKLNNLQQNLDSVNVSISESEAVAIRKILDQLPVTGTRYAAEQMKGINI